MKKISLILLTVSTQVLSQNLMTPQMPFGNNSQTNSNQNQQVYNANTGNSVGYTMPPINGQNQPNHIYNNTTGNSMGYSLPQGGNNGVCNVFSNSGQVIGTIPCR
jgi:hypothetical protein